MKTCQFCNKNVLGRSDKKFCDDHCRSAFNNKKYSEKFQSIKEVDRVLKRNRNILAIMFEHTQNSIDERKIMELGFMFQFHTHVKKHKNGQQIVFCYDYGYSKSQKGLVDICKEAS
ncbi:MAG: hypothetical protein MH472_06010 [Bacteroidia bacterium]|nr:hypothetical protein [Bacteroidia bacterium]